MEVVVLTIYSFVWQINQLKAIYKMDSIWANKKHLSFYNLKPSIWKNTNVIEKMVFAKVVDVENIRLTSL